MYTFNCSPTRPANCQTGVMGMQERGTLEQELELARRYVPAPPFEGLTEKQMSLIMSCGRNLYKWFKAHTLFHNLISAAVILSIFAADFRLVHPFLVRLLRAVIPGSRSPLCRIVACTRPPWEAAQDIAEFPLVIVLRYSNGYCTCVTLETCHQHPVAMQRRRSPYGLSALFQIGRGLLITSGHSSLRGR